MTIPPFVRRTRPQARSRQRRTNIEYLHRTTNGGNSKFILRAFGLILVTSIVLLSMGAGCESRQGKIDIEKIEKVTGSGKREIVRSISFTGNRAYKDKTLQKKLGFKTGDYIDPILAEAYRTTLAEFYRQNGFPYTSVSLDSDKLSKGEVFYIIDEGPKVRIASVKFSGNKAIKAKSLKKVIKTKSRKWLVRPCYYNEETVAEDVEKLKRVYYDEGFLNNKIEQQLRFSSNKRNVHIIFAIDEGAVYTVNKIALIGNLRIDDETLMKGFKLQQGDIYRYRLAELHARHIKRLYQERGYMNANAEQRPAFVADTDVVNVEFNITEGRQFRIGRIDITGNEKTQDKVIRRVLDEDDFTPGHLYNANIAPKQGGGILERKVQAMVMAEEAIIRPVGEPYMYDQNEPEVLGQNVTVGIKEGQTGMIMLGGGVSSDAGVMGQFVFQQRNFDIKDWPRSFKDFITGKAFKGAGQTLRISLSPGTEISQYSIAFTEPYLNDKPISLDVVASSWMRYRESYEEQRTKGYVGFEKRYKNRWRKSIGIRCENVDVSGFDIDAPQEIIDFRGENVLYGVKLGIGRDLRNDRWSPTAGKWYNASYEQVTGDETFGILSGTYRRYKTLHTDLAGQKIVMATKLLAAAIVGDAPPFEKFYAGGTGAYGIRGFSYRGISTRGLQTNVPAGTAERKDPIGSDWIFLANTEVTVPLTSQDFAALFFVDSGVIDTGGYRAAAGIGIQIMIPQWFGPVPMRFELATPFMKDNDDQTRTFSFSVGALF